MRFNQLSTWISVLYLLCIQASAHFMLNYPTSLGFVDEKEGTAPCGGFDVTFNNASDFHVDGDAVALTSTHPQADWLFRATLDKNATGNNWTDLLPPVSESGLGQYCEPSLAVPSQWAGNIGIIQVLQHGDDGLLFQCAAVNFVAGKATAPPSTCKNATGLTASFTVDASLPASTVAATGAPSGSATGSGSSTMSTTPAPSSSTSKSAAAPGSRYAGEISVIWSVLAASGLVTVMAVLSRL